MIVLLRELPRFVMTCTERLNSQEVGNMLYGLQDMKSDCPEVKALLRELPRLVKTCTEPLTAQAVGNMLYGLQDMKSDCPEVRVLLRELLRLVKTCTKLDAQAVGNMLYGLQDMKSDCPEVRALWRELPREQNAVLSVFSCTQGSQCQNQADSECPYCQKAFPTEPQTETSDAINSGLINMFMKIARQMIFL